MKTFFVLIGLFFLLSAFLYSQEQPRRESRNPKELNQEKEVILEEKSLLELSSQYCSNHCTDETVENTGQNIQTPTQGVSRHEKEEQASILASAIDGPRENAPPVLVEIATLLTNQLFPPNGGSRTKDLSESTKRKFVNLFGIDPCHPSILASSIVTKFRDAWLNRAQLDDYMDFLTSALNELKTPNNETPLDRTINQHLTTLSQFQGQAQALFPDELNAQLNAQSGARDISIEDILPCIGEKVEKLGLPQPSDRSLNFIFYTLFRGPKRVSHSTANQLIRKCAQNIPAGFEKCLLKSVGYKNADKILDLQNQTGIIFVGYNDQDLAHFESIFQESPDLFSKEKELHNTRAVIRPDSVQSNQNEFLVGDNSIRMWGPNESMEFIKQRYMQGQFQGCGDRNPQEFDQKLAESILNMHKVAFYHEFGHSVYDKLVQPDQQAFTERGNPWYEFGWLGNQPNFQKKNGALSCDGVEFEQIRPNRCNLDMRSLRHPDLVAQKNGFITFYGATNPSEEFAETIASYFTGSPTIKNAQGDIGNLAQKYQYIKQLLNAQSSPHSTLGL